MRTEDEALKLYENSEELAYSTVQKRFNSASFMSFHGLTPDDLKQYGRIGLYKACKDYDSTKGAQFKTYAINRIVGSIINESVKDSLGNINRSTFELARRVSMDSKSCGSIDEDLVLHDVVGVEDNGFGEIETNMFLDSVKTTLSSELAMIIKMKIDGCTLEEIGAETGVSKQAVEQMLKRNKEKVINLLQIS